MNGAILLVIFSVCFLLGYRFFAKWLERKLGVDPSKTTPAVTKNDGCDYVPAHPTVLFGHHFAAIAGAGPIVGPVLAAEFGWVPVICWILFGCIFIAALRNGEVIRYVSAGFLLSLAAALVVIAFLKGRKAVRA